MSKQDKLSTNYTYITEKDLEVLSTDILKSLLEKYELKDFFIKNDNKYLSTMNQLLDLVHTQIFDPSLHRILLNFCNELFSSNPIFTSHMEQLKPLFTVKLAEQDSLDQWPYTPHTYRLGEIAGEINELIALKRRYPMVTYKQLLTLWVFEYLQKTTLVRTNKTIALVMELADTFLKEKKFEQFALVISELADFVRGFDDVTKHAELFHSLYQSFDEKPPSAKNISDSQREEIERKLKTPPAILTLIEQEGFQKLRTDYCPVICALVSTYSLIHHIVVIHEKDGLILDDLKNEFFRLIHVNPSDFNGEDRVSDMINAFYHSDFYKKRIKSDNYPTRHTIEGWIDFKNGGSFNTHIKTNREKSDAFVHDAADIGQLHHLLNIALINLLQNKTTNIFKIVSLLSVGERPDLIQTVSHGQGYWLGVPHVVVKLKEGIVNAPKNFKIDNDGLFGAVPIFAFQPISTMDTPHSKEKKNTRTSLVNDLKKLLVDYQKDRAEQYQFKDKFFSSDKKAREVFIAQLHTLFVDYEITGNNNKLLTEIDKHRPLFPGDGLSSVLNKISIKLMDFSNVDNLNESTLSVAEVLSVQKEIHSNYVEQITSLYDALSAMRELAQILVNLNEQKVLSSLTNELCKDVDCFVKSHSTTLPTKEDFIYFKAKFSARLHSEDKIMSQHEHLWKPIITNILIALFTLGTVLAFQLIKSKITTGRVLFFGVETEKQTMINQVDHAVSNLCALQ